MAIFFGPLKKSNFILFQSLPLLAVNDILKEADHTPTADNIVDGGYNSQIILVVRKALLANQEVGLGQLPPLPAVEDDLDRRLLV